MSNDTAPVQPVHIDLTTPEGVKRIQDYVRLLRLQIVNLEQKDIDQRRIIENRNRDITRLENEIIQLRANLAAALSRTPRPMLELIEELDDWYLLAGGLITHLRAIGQKHCPTEEVQPDD